MMIDTTQEVPAGTITFTMCTTSPPGWQILDGSTITDADVKHPELWDRIAATYKSGSSIVLPDTRGRSAIGAGSGGSLTARTAGTTGGVETHALSEAELASHTHVQNQHLHSVAAHTHSIAHNHASATTSSDTHNHGNTWAKNVYPSTSSWYFISALGDSTGAQNMDANGTILNDSHSHTLNLPNYSGNSGAASASTTNNTTPTNQTTGSGTAHENMPPWVAFPMMVKL